MRIEETLSTAPIETEKSVRGDEIRVLTSCKAGKIVPVAYIPMLREDQVSRGNIRIALDMAETVHPLMNAVNVTAYAHFVPFLAFDRFTGMESFNRAYRKEGEPHNGVPIPFFSTGPYNRDHEFWRTMGIHWKQGEQVNTAALEAYNVLVNWRRKVRSEHLPQRTALNTTLAQAFWKNPMMSHVVPDWDQAAMDGEVPLEFSVSNLPVRSRSAGTEAGGLKYPRARTGFTPPIDGEGGMTWQEEIFVEMKNSGIKLSLSNIELAKQVAAFAKLRDKFAAHDDDYIIDLLMQGIRVPDEALKQPILLDRKSTIFGYNERHAMDGASLDMSVTTGQTSLDLTFRTPPMNVGGCILITVEIVPEQLFERLYDTFLGTTDPDKLPRFDRDYLDPEKVEVVQNRFVDVEHATPTGTFGYAPLNHAWKRSFTRIGGKYFRRNPDQFVEDRQRFWSVEQLNPTLSTDFYLVNNLPHSVFLDTLSDPFEVLALGNVQIIGNTVFGKTLEEDQGSYDDVMAIVDTKRIVQP